MVGSPPPSTSWPSTKITDARTVRSYFMYIVIGGDPIPNVSVGGVW